MLARWREKTGMLFPTLEFDWWLAVLIVAVAALAALTPLVYRGAAWARPASYVLGVAMMANGVHHLLSPLYLGRFLPGQYTSPLLVIASLWLITTARRTRQAADAGGSRAGALAGTLAFFVAAPVTVAGWIPYAIAGWTVGPPLLGTPALRAVGVAMLAAGAAALVDCFARFALLGRGTPAPVAPTESLVVSGLYRYMRNPMYVAVLTVIVGQALLLGSVAVLWYAGLVWAAAFAFVVFYEEPTLRQQFGISFEEYRAHVPRWIPRLTPWCPRRTGDRAGKYNRAMRPATDERDVE